MGWEGSRNAAARAVGSGPLEGHLLLAHKVESYVEAEQRAPPKAACAVEWGLPVKLVPAAYAVKELDLLGLPLVSSLKTCGLGWLAAGPHRRCFAAGNTL